METFSIYCFRFVICDQYCISFVLIFRKLTKYSLVHVLLVDIYVPDAFLGKNYSEEDLLQNRLYLFQLISPLRYLVTKILFLSFVYFILQLVIFFIFQLLIPMNSLLSWHWLWICLLTALGMCSISVVGSFFSYLASQNGHLQMILSLPFCFPIVGLAYAATLVLADGGAWSKMFTLGSMLMAVDLFNLAMILFVVSLMWKHG